MGHIIDFYWLYYQLQLDWCVYKINYFKCNSIVYYAMRKKGQKPPNSEVVCYLNKTIREMKN